MTIFGKKARAAIRKLKSSASQDIGLRLLRLKGRFFEEALINWFTDGSILYLTIETDIITVASIFSMKFLQKSFYLV